MNVQDNQGFVSSLLRYISNCLKNGSIYVSELTFTPSRDSASDEHSHILISLKVFTPDGRLTKWLIKNQFKRSL